MPHAPVALLLLLIAGPAAWGQSARPAIPVAGKEIPGLEPLDAAVVAMMQRHGIPGGSLAVAVGGKLVFARGYGWADLDAGERVRPDTRFGVASLSKTFTALAVLKLVEAGKLRLDDRAFELLRHVRPRPGTRVDPRLYRITVRQLLHHAGGWDHRKSGDPVNWVTQVQSSRGDRTPITAEHLIEYVMRVPLDFDPGADSKYSNFGYIVLGEVVQTVAREPYERYVREHVLAPAGVRAASLHPLPPRYFPNEAHRYLAGTETELPAWHQKYSDAAGGWSVSAVDVLRVLTALDGSRGRPLLGPDAHREMTAAPPPPHKPRAGGAHVGLGWDSVFTADGQSGYFKDGSWYGMRAFMKRLPAGVNWVLLFNASMNPDPTDNRAVADAVGDVREALERLAKFPDTDLFPEFGPAK